MTGYARDMGCSSILVKQELIKADQYTGKFGLIKLADCTVREVPLAIIEIDTPYLTGDLNALCPRRDLRSRYRKRPPCQRSQRTESESVEGQCVNRVA